MRDATARAPPRGGNPTEPDPRPTARRFEQSARLVAGGSRGRAAVAAWIVALLAVPIVGLGGRLRDEPAPRMVDPPSQSPRVAVAPAPPRAKSVVLNDPAPPPATVTGIPLWVRGQAAPAVRQVVIVLSDGEVQVGFQVVEPTRAGSFSAVFTLRPPRPEMELTVVVVGRDSRAQPVGSAGRPVLISALEAAADATPRASLGEDGVLGSRGVAGLRPPEAPRASPRP